MIAVCLLTCGREDLTRRTCETFWQFNSGRRDLIPLWADGGPWPAMQEVPRWSFPFLPVHLPTERVPQMVSYRKLIEAAALKGAEFVVWLENDWESVAPIPTIDFLRTCQIHRRPKQRKNGKMTPARIPGGELVQWRLFGTRKMREDGPRALAGEHRIGTKDKIDWTPAPESGWEFGRAHWGAGGTIATLDFLEEQLFRNRLKDVITSKNDLPTLRPIENVMFHIGETTTEGFRG